eukprot:359290-Chlamydomonas_euryale.AAC.1
MPRSWLHQKGVASTTCLLGRCPAAGSTRKMWQARPACLGDAPQLAPPERAGGCFTTAHPFSRTV